ncbi:MAG: hypothetical protein ABII18_04115 [bacterium]
MNVLFYMGGSDPNITHHTGVLKEADINNDGTMETFTTQYQVNIRECEIIGSRENAELKCPATKKEGEDLYDVSLEYTQPNGRLSSMGVRNDSTPDTRIFIVHAKGYTAAIAPGKTPFAIGETVALPNGTVTTIQDFVFHVDYATLDVTSISARVYINREGVDIPLADLEKVVDN